MPATLSKDQRHEEPQSDSAMEKSACQNKRSRQLNTIYLHLLLNQVALLTPYTQRSIILSRMPRFQGDMAEVAKYMTLLSSGSAIVVILLQSIAGKASDAFGRRLFLAMGPLANLLLKLLVFISPSARNIALERIFGVSISTVAGTAISVAAISDLFKGNMRGFAQALSYIGTLVGLGLLTGPIAGELATRLFRRGPQSAFLLSAFFSAIQLCNLWRLEETVQSKDRKAFKLVDINPFSFLRLLWGDFRLLKLSVLAGVCHNVSEGKNIADLHQSYSKKDVGLADNMRWAVTSGVGLWVGLSGYISRELMKRMGERNFTTMASSFRVLGMTWYSLVPWRVKQLWTMIVGSFIGSFGWQSGKYPQAVAIGYAVNKCKWGRGEITAAINQLREVYAIFGPLVYARLYAWGTANGQPGVHYFFIAMLCAATEVYGRSIITM